MAQKKLSLKQEMMLDRIQDYLVSRIAQEYYAGYNNLQFADDYIDSYAIIAKIRKEHCCGKCQKLF